MVLQSGCWPVFLQSDRLLNPSRRRNKTCSVTRDLRSLSLPDGVVTDELLLKLSPLTQLRSFDLMGMRYGAAVSARGFAVLLSFPHLHELRLDGLILSDEVTIPIGTLTELRSLQFYRAPITDAGIANLSAFAPGTSSTSPLA